MTSPTTITVEGPAGLAAALDAFPNYIEFDSGVAGTLSAPLSTAGPYTPPAPCTLASIRLGVLTAPTGQAVIVDILRNGTSIFSVSANRPTIAPGATTSLTPASNASVTTFSSTDVLTASLVQVGSGTAGAGLSVQVYMNPVV